MKKRNSKKEARLAGFLERPPIYSVIEKFTKRLAFNFQFFDNSQRPHGADFSDLTHDQLKKLIEKIKFISNESLTHWESTRTGPGTSKIIAVYGKFPDNSDFTHPKHVPCDVKWARIRIEGDFRLIGFVSTNVKYELNDKEFPLIPDVFYVVFLDIGHKFYKGKD